MYKIKRFVLVGYQVADSQVITGGDFIKISVVIGVEDITMLNNFVIDCSQYSNNKRRQLKFFPIGENTYESELIVKVDFVGSTSGIMVGRNHLSSRVSLLSEGKLFFSNPIGNADYNNFYEKDHHLGVYTNRNLGMKQREKLIDISQQRSFPNDIIFINRHFGNNHFIDVLGKNIENILLTLVSRIQKKDSFVILYSSEKNFVRNYGVIQKYMHKIMKFQKYIHIYFYNIPFCIFKNREDSFIEDHILYNGIYRIPDGYSDFGICQDCSYKKLCNTINDKYYSEFGGEEFSSL